MKDEFRKDERLYRNVIMDPNFWKKDSGGPSSAVFKDSNGVSVDRDGGREEADITSGFISRFGVENIRAIVSVNAGYCMEIGAHLVYSPVETNKYHAEIHDSPDKVPLHPKKARKLAKNCRVVYASEEDEK